MVHRTERIILKLRPNAIPIVENYLKMKSNAEHEPFAANTANFLFGDDCDDVNIEISFLFDNVTPRRNDNCNNKM